LPIEGQANTNAIKGCQVLGCVHRESSSTTCLGWRTESHDELDGAAKKYIEIVRGASGYGPLQLEPTEGSATIVYFDCDLYRAAVEILEVLERDHILQDGTVVMGDDRDINRANPPFGQRRALGEFLERNQGCDAASPHLDYWLSPSTFILHNTAVPRRSRQGLRPCRF
jgi:hypothetical protein